MKSRYKKLDFDKLQLYFREPLVIDCEDTVGQIVVHQPSIGDIVHIGEKKFYKTLDIFITNTTSYRLPLWELGIDWNEFSDFQLFCMLLPSVDKDVCKLFFHDLDFDNFKRYEKRLNDKEEQILYDQVHNIEINEEVYQYMHQYFQTIFNLFPDEKITKDNVLKKWYLDKDKRQMEINQIKDTSKDNSIVNLISSCVNHPGFKYKLNELREVGVYEFYDSCKRLQIYEQTTACLQGMYSGFVDSSQFKMDDYNFMRST